MIIQNLKIQKWVKDRNCWLTKTGSRSVTDMKLHPRMWDPILKYQISSSCDL